MQLGPDDDWLLHFAQSAFIPENPKSIGLAVSGGSDSMAMLYLQANCAKKDGRRLQVATVDHGLRPEAAKEAAFVASECEALGIPHSTLKWRGWDGSGNLPAKAREARYRLLADWAKDVRCDVVCLGHTQDDVAETFLMRLGRSAGLDGLAAMESAFERNGVNFRRPVIYHSREELRSFLTRHQKTWCDDPSNDDPKYDRARTRKILETLEALGITRSNLSQSAHHLQSAKLSLKYATYEHAKNILNFDRGDARINRFDLAGTEMERRRRIFMGLFQWMSGSEYPPRSSKMFDLDFLGRGGKPYMVHGCALTHGEEGLRISREYNAVRNKSADTTEVWDTRWQLEGPHSADLEIRALGPLGLPQCPDWRDVGLPRTSLLASPAIWSNGELIAAPLAKLNPEWTATLIRGEKQFFSSIVPH